MNDHLENTNDAISDLAHIELTEAHLDLVNTVKQVADGKPVIFASNGKQIAALISIEDLYLLERLIEEEEDRIDIVDAERILAETKDEDWIPFEQVKAELGR